MSRLYWNCIYTEFCNDLNINVNVPESIKKMDLEVFKRFSKMPKRYLTLAGLGLVARQHKELAILDDDPVDTEDLVFARKLGRSIAINRRFSVKTGIKPSLYGIGALLFKAYVMCNNEEIWERSKLCIDREVVELLPERFEPSLAIHYNSLKYYWNSIDHYCQVNIKTEQNKNVATSV